MYIFYHKYSQISIVLQNKKAGNARSKPLAYLSFVCIPAMQNSKVDFEQFPMEQKKSLHTCGKEKGIRNAFLRYAMCL